MEPLSITHDTLKESLEIVLTRQTPNSILVVASDRSLDSTFICEYLRLICNGASISTYTDVTSNPTLETIQKCAVAWRGTVPDLVVAIGGGSALDTAKAAHFLAQQDTDNFEEVIRGVVPVCPSTLPLIAIPTTAGSGSEATHFAVVYINGKKHSLAHPSMRPQFVILQPELTYSLNPYQTAVSGLDVLAQSIESIWSVQSTEESKRCAFEALQLVWVNLEAVVHTPNPENRAAMQQAAYLAGKAINISKTTAAHAMSYALTTEYGIPHGHAVALTLPELLLFNSTVTEETVADERGAEYVLATMQSLYDVLGAEDATDAALQLRRMVVHVGLEDSLRALAVSEESLPKIVASLSLDRAGNNPRTFTELDALDTMKAIL